jgi:hypothetical protein
MGLPGLVRVCLRDKVRRVSGLARPWRAPALIAALDAEPETVPALLVATQRFFAGHPFSSPSYEGLLGSVRRVRVDRRYTETPAGQGRLVVDLETRRVRFDVRGVGWRRAGWLYYHDGEVFTRHRVPFRVPAAWRIEGSPEETEAPVAWNDGGPEPFAYLFEADA